MKKGEKFWVEGYGVCILVDDCPEDRPFAYLKLRDQMFKVPREQCLVVEPSQRAREKLASFTLLWGTGPITSVMHDVIRWEEEKARADYGK